MTALRTPLMIAAAALAFLGVGCSSSDSGSSAEQLYGRYDDKYSPVFDEFAKAYPDPNATPATFQTAITSACHPDPNAASMEGLAVTTLTPVLAQHGHSYPEFKRDTEALNAKITAEGLCGNGQVDGNAECLSLGYAPGLCADPKWKTLTGRTSHPD